MTVVADSDALALNDGAMSSAGGHAVRRGRGLDSLHGCAVGLLVAAGLLVSCADRAGETPLVTRAGGIPDTDPGHRPELNTPIPRSKPTPPPLAVALMSPPSDLSRPADPVQDVALVPGGQTDFETSSPPEEGLDPKHLVGLTERETLRLLGEPTRTEEKPPAKTWAYTNDRCVLRVFFFMETTTRDFRTLSYELISRDEQPHVAQQCFAELVAQAGHSGP